MSRISILVAALAVTLGSTAVFADKVGPKDIKKNAVKSKHIQKNQVKSSDIKDGGIGEKDLSDDVVERMLYGAFEFIDANGMVIGPALDRDQVVLELTSSNMLGASTPEAALGDLLVVHLDRDGFHGELAYTKEKCEGEVYIIDRDEAGALMEIHGGPDPVTGRMTGWMTDYGATQQERNFKSTYGWNWDNWSATECVDEDYDDYSKPAIKVMDLGMYTIPFKGRRVQ